jgi:carboxyl-terminal processing protease
MRRRKSNRVIDNPPNPMVNNRPKSFVVKIYTMRLSKVLNTSLAILALTAIAALSSAQTVNGKPEVKKEVLDKITYYLTHSAFVPGIDFNKWPDFLKENKDKIDASTDDDTFQRAVNTALSEFGASHIVMTTPNQADQRRTGATVGIGISSQTTPDGILVVRTVKDAPAEKAGIVAGDTIIEVDGKKVDGIRGIPGPEGTDVKLKVKRADASSKDFTLTRRKFSTVRPEELTWLNPDTAKLNIYTFDFSYDRQNVEKLMQEASKAKNLIVDLRDNGGGAVVNLEHMLGLLMNPEQPIGTFIGKDAINDFIKETKGDPKDLEAVANWSDDKIRPRRNRNVAPYHGNLMVFINAFTGSASEIAAEALQENVKAKIIGTKSAGAVLVSVIVPAADGFMIQYPLSDYVTIRGKRLEGTGVTPDVEAKDPLIRLPSSKDACVEAALGLVAQTKNPSSGGR